MNCEIACAVFMHASGKGSAQPLLAEQPLTLVLRGEPEGPPLIRAPVQAADLSALMAEAWREVCLRGGYPAVPFDQLTMRLMPHFVDRSATRCTGFALEVTLPDGRRRQHPFSLRSLRQVAHRAAGRLIAQGALAADQACYYDVVVERAPAAQVGLEVSGASCSVTVHTPPLSFLETPLRPLLERATVVRLTPEETFPVFFTAPALARAEESARRGACADPPVETGGVLIGSLAVCGLSKEFFVVVTDVLEVPEAEQTAFSLSYTQRSWARIQAMLRARQAACPDRAERLIGQCHGHSFVPKAGNACDSCDQRSTCSLTSVFVSPEDETWMQSVFARQPWALCHIFGLSACREPVSGLYSLRDGGWHLHNYHVLPELNLKPPKSQPHHENERQSPGREPAQ